MAGEILLLEYSDIIGDAFTKGSGRIYAMIFDPITNKALEFSAAIPYTLQNFDGDQDRFSYIVPPTQFRGRHYSTILSCTSFTLPDVGYGNYYTIEYWEEAVSGIQNRDTDTYLSVDRLTWLSNRRAESRLDLSQEIKISELAAVKVWDYLQSLVSTPDSIGEFVLSLATPDVFFSTILSNSQVSGTFEDLFLDVYDRTSNLPDEPASARYEAFCACVYDTVNSRISFVAWLEKDGALQTNAQRATILMVDQQETTVANLIITSISAQGQFRGSADGIALNPDETFFCKATIKDVNNFEHTSGSGPVSWD